ncbi:MAG: hypothetical protein M1824_001973 [Vezdaea acicularis]|nr:MAG: hypothetical protein M1824_001973 [Vezdaea acicularis]
MSINYKKYKVLLFWHEEEYTMVTGTKEDCSWINAHPCANEKARDSHAESEQKVQFAAKEITWNECRNDFMEAFPGSKTKLREEIGIGLGMGLG